MLKVFRFAVLCLTLAAGGPAALSQTTNTFTPSAAFSEKVMKAFRQGQNNDFNCASIALVKVAIANFGPENLSGVVHEGALKSDDVSADGTHKIQLNDGSNVTLTAAEIKQATSQSGFTIPVDDKNPGDAFIRDRANLLYAVMAKKAFLIHDGSETFADAVTYGDAISILQQGRNFEYLAPLLGLVANDAGDADNLPALSSPAYVYTNNWHAVFSNGTQFDQYGEPTSIESFNGLHTKKFHKPFMRAKENWAFTVSAPSTSSIASM